MSGQNLTSREFKNRTKEKHSGGKRKPFHGFFTFVT